MSIAKNPIKFSDISVAPIKLKYSASYSSQSFADLGITINSGVNNPTSSLGPSTITTYNNNYRLVRQLYYQDYISGSLLGTGSAWDSSLQSTAASGSMDADIRSFPTQSNARVSFLAIPRTVFGENISRNTLAISSTNGTTYKLIDDGNGNVIDAKANYVHVGNVIYSQGIITVTNPDYVSIFSNNDFGFTVQNFVVSPSPSITVSKTPSVTPTVSITPSISITPSVTPSITPTVSRTPSITPSVTPSYTPSISLTPSKTPSVSISVSPVPVYSATVYMNSFVDYPYGYADAATACSLGGYTGVAQTVYYTGTLGNGTTLYFSPSLNPGDAFDFGGSFGWYWISGFRFQYSGGISSYAAC
jgi:hypothetical protein